MWPGSSGATRADPPPEAAGDALRANLARTAVVVDIPVRHQVLLDVTAGRLGLHAATEAMLREVNHRYVGWPQVLVDVHRRAMGDLHLYAAHARCAEAIGVFCELYGKVAGEATPAEVRHDAVRQWLTYLEKIAAEPEDRLPGLIGPLRAGLLEVDREIDEQPALAGSASGRLKRLVATLAARGAATAPATADAADLLARCLAATYRDWLARDDAAALYRSAGGHTVDGAIPEPVATLSHAGLGALDARLAASATAPLAERAVTLAALPDNAWIVHAYLDAADLFRDDAPRAPARILDEIHWLTTVLGRPDLAAVHEPALRRVSGCCSALLARTDGEHPAGLLREVFGLLRAERFPHGRAVHDLIRQIGRDVVATEDAALADVLFDEILSLDFAYPEFAGFTEEWAVVANPDHLRSVRAYLGVIEVDPLLARPLLTALVLHLRLGEFLVTDTDLFQRDISSLLARPVGPVYLYVKQLLRLVPVYFREIGAEGALRRWSTELDELEGRRDPVCHFLRKQSHVECNPRLIGFIEDLLRFHVDGDAAPLRRVLPPQVAAALAERAADDAPLADVLRRLAAASGGVDALLSMDADEVARRIGTLRGADPVAARKAELLVRVREEIRRKYDLGHDDVVARLLEFGRVDRARVHALADALARGDHAVALDHVLGALEELKRLILREGPPEASEDIYYKRHIAAGIPSMYGSYREVRCDAMGLTFRLESLATALFQRVIDDDVPVPPRREDLVRVAGWLRLLLRALRIDGYRAQGLTHCLGILDETLTREETTHDQFVNVFWLTSRNVETLIRARILDVYDRPARRVIARMLERGLLPMPEGCDAHEAVMRHSEAVLRDLIAESFGLQMIDALVGRVLGALLDSRPDGPPAPRPHPRRTGTAVRIDGAEEGPGVVALGNKGYMLTRLRRLGHPVPDGFILGTDLVAEVGDAAPPRIATLVREEVHRLESLSGTRFGDPARPLLLSVRGGAPISMPGLLETFLNVGLNRVVAEGMASMPDRAWSAWDGYRRLLQFWGMSHGMERDGFDALVREEKRRHGASRKALLPADGMRRLALEYADLLAREGVPLVDDPYAQLLACIARVGRSWDAPAAVAYRRELGISDAWGTAVIVQTMVFGNLGPRSGTGVAITRDRRTDAGGVGVRGDFVVQAQGDDVVGGLVETLPLTERQRIAETPGAPASLEADFPAVHAALERLARSLVREHGMNHQEIEFTFEGDREEDFFVLQTRDTVVAPPSTVVLFEPTPDLARARVATGIGVAGGALSGRIAHGASDLPGLARRHPGEAVILLRPDTTPDDIPVVLRVDGVLTAIGGATSHAAVAAKRLGKTCVVGCRALEVHEREGWSRLGGHLLRTGDLVSISGIDGSVYLGGHAVTRASVRGRAQE